MADNLEEIVRIEQVLESVRRLLVLFPGDADIIALRARLLARLKANATP